MTDATGGTPAVGTGPGWVVLLTRLPFEPVDVRLQVVGDLRRIGAAPIGAGAWVLPDGQPFLQELDAVIETAARHGGSIAALHAAPRDSATGSLLAAAFSEVRRDAWTQFESECRTHLDALNQNRHLPGRSTLDLPHEERCCERLRLRFSDLRTRDVLDLPGAISAQQALDAYCQAVDRLTTTTGSAIRR